MSEIQRIPPVRTLETPVIRQIPRPITQRTTVPIIRSLRPPVVDVPAAEIPSYEPIIVNPEAIKPKSKQKRGGGKEEKEESTEGSRPPLKAPTPEVPKSAEIQIPFTDYALPVPSTTQVTLATTTAFAATGAALVGKSVMDYLIKILKPMFKIMWLKLKQRLGKPLTQVEIQQHFLFEHEPDLKVVAKLLAKEARQQKIQQEMDAQEQ